VSAINGLTAAPGSSKSVAPLAAKIASYLMTLYKSESEPHSPALILWSLCVEEFIFEETATEEVFL
jgi:hypothetical protein